MMVGIFIKPLVAITILSTPPKKEKSLSPTHEKTSPVKPLKISSSRPESNRSKITLRQGSVFHLKKDHYIYPAVFEYSNDGISISFPDLPGCFSCANTDQEAIRMASDALSLHLYSLEEDNDEIPNPTPISDIRLESNQAVVLIEVYMPTMREAIENQSIKKTLTIPQWLNKIAVEKNVNFSQVLQSALKDRLGIKDKP